MYCQGESSPIVDNGGDVKHRDFKIFVLNDNYKNMQQRSAVIKDWANQGGESEYRPAKRVGVQVLSAGVLMMGYELYRQLSNKKSRKKKGKNYPTVEESKEKNESSLYGK